MNATVTTTIYASKLDEVRKAISRANDRLARNGAIERFVHVEDPRKELVIDRDGNSHYVSLVDIELLSPSLAVSGWEFLASVDIIEGGTVLRTVPGVDLTDIVRPDDHTCDHCQTKRARKHTYLLRHQVDGNIVQVGKTCLKLFLGETPSALWAIGWNLDKFKVDTTDGTHSSASSEDYLYDVRAIIDSALRISNNGKNFISKSYAAAAGWTVTSTATEVKNDTIYAFKASGDRSDEINDALVDEVIAAASEVDGDYGRNLNAVLSSKAIPAQDIGIAVSAVGVWVRAKKAAERAATPSAVGFYGDKGEKIADLSGEITVLRDVYTDYGTSRLLVVRTAENKLIKWFGRVPYEIDDKEIKVGQKIVFTRATVKGQESFNGEDQTCVFRAKIAFPTA